MDLKQTTSYEYSDGLLNRVLSFQTKDLMLKARYKNIGINQIGLYSLAFKNGNKVLNINLSINQLHLLHDALGDILAEHEAFEYEKNIRYKKNGKQ